MRVIMYPAVSLDGFIAERDGDSDSWINAGDEVRYEAAVDRAGCVITGRITFEEYKDDFLARKNCMTFVCTRQDNTAEDTDQIKYLHNSPEEMCKIIESHGFTEAIICGGGEINGLFAIENLVDEIIISVQPVVLGAGIPLFGSYKPHLKLELLSTNTDIPNVMQLHYKVKKR